LLAGNLLLFYNLGNLTPKQVPGAPGQTEDIQLVVKPYCQSQLAIGKNFCIYAAADPEE
jgi:hypothetical protein